jgi:hypothetical protein
VQPRLMAICRKVFADLRAKRIVGGTLGAQRPHFDRFICRKLAFPVTFRVIYVVHACPLSGKFISS